MIVPTSSTSQVFVSDERSMRNDNPPIDKLDDNHIFVLFVKEFWRKMTTTGAGDSLINAYASLQFNLKTRDLPKVFRQYICTQLCLTPPDIRYCSHQRFGPASHWIPSTHTKSVAIYLH